MYSYLLCVRPRKQPNSGPTRLPPRSLGSPLFGGFGPHPSPAQIPREPAFWRFRPRKQPNSGLPPVSRPDFWGARFLEVSFFLRVLVLLRFADRRPMADKVMKPNKVLEAKKSPRDAGCCSRPLQLWSEWHWLTSVQLRALFLTAFSLPQLCG